MNIRLGVQSLRAHQNSIKAFIHSGLERELNDFGTVPSRTVNNFIIKLTFARTFDCAVLNKKS